MGLETIHIGDGATPLDMRRTGGPAVVVLGVSRGAAGLIPLQAAPSAPADSSNDLVDSTGGTPNGAHTLVDITGSDTVDLADVEANFATLAAEINLLRAAAVANNAAIDALIALLAAGRVTH